jgi:hypothetical protein
MSVRVLNEVFTMTDRVKPPDAARKGAQKYFTATEQHETLARQEIEKARTTNAAKIAKLRGASSRQRSARLARRPIMRSFSLISLSANGNHATFPV